MRTCLKRFVNRIDILFIGGDFANIQHKDIEEEEEEEEMEKTEDRKRKRTYEETLLQGISNLCDLGYSPFGTIHSNSMDSWQCRESKAVNYV